MFKEFWKEKKSSIEIVVILTAIGAIFLSISPPEKEEALVPFLNLQLFWLIAMTIGIAVLFWNFFIFTQKVEVEVTEKVGINLIATISLGLLMGSGWFLFNLWKYIFGAYEDSAIRLFTLLSLFAPILLVPFIVYFVEKLTTPLIRNKIFQKIVALVFSLFLSTFVFSIFVEMFIYNLEFSPARWLNHFFFRFPLLSLLILPLVLLVFFKNKFRKFLIKYFKKENAFSQGRNGK